VDVLWFVGDYASFDPRNQKVSQVSPRCCMKRASISAFFMTASPNAGNDVRRVGEEGLYEVLATANVNALSSASFKSVVTTDPHSFNTIRNELSRLRRQIRDRALHDIGQAIVRGRTLASHQSAQIPRDFSRPCHLGRFNKGYDAPRELLALLGCELVEMGRCKANSFCCGAGGGRIWVPDPVGSEKPAQESDEEAAAIPGLEVYVVSCPKGSHHVRGTHSKPRQRGQIRGQGTHRTHSRSHALAPAPKRCRMKILVAVKQVAALDEDFAIRDDGRDVDPDFLIRDLNEWDDFSLEEAVKIKEASGVPVEVHRCVGRDPKKSTNLAQMPGQGRRSGAARLG